MGKTLPFFQSPGTSPVLHDFLNITEGVCSHSSPSPILFFYLFFFFFLSKSSIMVHLSMQWLVYTICMVSWSNCSLKNYWGTVKTWFWNLTASTIEHIVSESTALHPLKINFLFRYFLNVWWVSKGELKQNSISAYESTKRT